MISYMFPDYFINSKLKKAIHQKSIINLISNYGNQKITTIIEELFKKDYEKIQENNLIIDQSDLSEKDKRAKKQMDLNNFYRKHYPYVFNLIKELLGGKTSKLKTRMLQKAETKKGFTKTEHEKYRSKPWQYYSLTENSLELLINHNSLSIDKFWKLVFYSNDKTHENQPKFDDVLFAQYEEKNNIKSSKDYFLPYFIKYNLEVFKIIISLDDNDIEYNPSDYKILKIIGFNKPITKKELLSKIPIKIHKSLKHFLTEEKCLMSIILNLKNNILIQELNQRNVVKYTLTHSGLLLLLYTKYFKDFRIVSPSYTIELRKGFKLIKDSELRSKIKKELSLIFKHNSHLIPEILNEENRKMFEIDDYYLIGILFMIYFDGSERFFIQKKLKEYLLLSRLRNLKEIDSIQKINEFHSSGIHTLTELIKNRKDENHYNFITNLSDEFFNIIQQKSTEIDKSVAKESLRESRKELSDLLKKKSKSNELLAHHKLIVKRCENDLKNLQYDNQNDLDFDSIVKWILYYNIDPKLKKSINKRDSNALEKIQGIAINKLRNYHLLIGNDGWVNDQDRVMKQKILFDFLLAFRELENERWNKVKNQIKFNNEIIGKWHDKKIKELIDFGQVQHDKILKDVIA